MDSDGRHRHPDVRASMTRHPRFVCHFVPTRSSGLNRVEHGFGELTTQAVWREAFVSVVDLQTVIAAPAPRLKTTISLIGDHSRMRTAVARQAASAGFFDKLRIWL